MSITHSLMLETQRSPQEIRALLLTSAEGLRPALNERLRGEGVHVHAGTIDALSRGIISDSYAVRPNVCVYFDLDSEEDEEEGERIIGRALATLLKNEPGDAVLLYVGEIPVLQRIGGRVVITDEHNEYGEWLTPPLDAAGIRYERPHALTPTA